MDKEILTVNNIKNLNKNIEKLKIEKLKILEEIKKARLFGDLSENSEYHTAKKKKFLIEKKIKDLESIISSCEIKKDNFFFKKIKLKNLENNKNTEYNIVNDERINNVNGFISINSPMARLLKNKKPGDLLKIKKYKKNIEFLITSIE